MNRYNYRIKEIKVMHRTKLLDGWLQTGSCWHVQRKSRKYKNMSYDTVRRCKTKTEANKFLKLYRATKLYEN